jgi:hypothetical protein
MYWLRSSAPIFSAMSGNSLTFSTSKARPPVSSRHFTQQRGPIQFLWRSAAVIQWVKDADRIQSGIRLSRQPLDIVFMVPTMVIAAVGYDEQGPFGVSSGPHLAEAQIYRIEQGSAAFRRCRE